jgi:hypothetical protein
MQCAYYNGHYKYHGGKVQHVLKADGMALSFTCPIQNHDALVLHNSSMRVMLSNVFINGDLNRPAVPVTDKAYKHSDDFKPIQMDAELQMMNFVERELALQFDKQHKKPRMAVEYSFNQQVTKFWHSDNHSTGIKLYRVVHRIGTTYTAHGTCKHCSLICTLVLWVVG